ncbi:MAG: hypothetical protein ACM3IJ_04065 [Candidatus Levyibacteriota bacterium]
MPHVGTIFGDVVETLKENTGKAAKEIARAPIDIVKASFEQPIPNPSAERQQQLKAEEQSKLAAVRSNLRAEVDAMKPRPEQPRVQQGAEMAERGQQNQMGKMNNTPLSASQTPKKKLEPLVVQQKRNNKLHGAG